VTIATYGSWKSPVTADLIVKAGVSPNLIRLDGDDIYWSEGRPSEGGRLVVVRWTDAGPIDITPPGYNARTRVHEYGGGAFLVDSGTVWFSNFDDQRLYRQDPGAEPRPVTPAADLRYADGVMDRGRGRIVCVQEDHTGPGEAVNTLVSLDPDGRSEAQVIASGNDFYSTPRLSPDGRRLAWQTWSHPLMPWDGNQLWVAELGSDGSIVSAQQVAGGAEESIYQPEWSPDGRLYFVSDRSGWWNLYRLEDGDRAAPVLPMEAEFGAPQWVFASTRYALESERRLICTYIEAGQGHIASLDPVAGRLDPIQSPYTSFGLVRAAPGMAVLLAAGPTEPAVLARLSLQTGTWQVLRLTSPVEIDPGYVSVAEQVEFPTTGGRTAYAFYYPPRNRDFTAPDGEPPPVVVHTHGGPTGMVTDSFNLGTQYWTSRGIGILDVNYGGSTGYGRAYRERLDGEWGVVDVDDCSNAALDMAGQGRVDAERLAISGGSAGGYTTLCALAFKDTFKAGASHFGIGDLETFVHDTHKFESRYLDRLVGPFPERRDLYRERSALNHLDGMSCPVIILQGLEDKIVPPSQAEQIVAALRAKGLPYAYLPFAGEQHGFRRAENIKRALEGELYFYSKIFGFDLGHPVEPVKIENLPATHTS
jgi:dipeptidyl aminopeptidase/acylaminoacyl peptidase